MEGELDRAGVVLDFITFKPLVKQVCDASGSSDFGAGPNSTAIQVHKTAQQVGILYKKQKLLFCPGVTSSFCRLPTRARSCWLNTLPDKLNARYGAISPAAIRYMEVAVEEARGQRGIFRDEF